MAPQRVEQVGIFSPTIRMRAFDASGGSGTTIFGSTDASTFTLGMRVQGVGLTCRSGWTLWAGMNFNAFGKRCQPLSVGTNSRVFHTRLEGLVGAGWLSGTACAKVMATANPITGLIIVLSLVCGP
jgi:hypothetical protein